MEQNKINSEVVRTKRTLTWIVVAGALVGLLSTVLRVVLGESLHDYSHPMIGLLGIGMILGLFVMLLALNTRVQVGLEETEYQNELERVEN